jgi:hypothetical protein
MINKLIHFWRLWNEPSGHGRLLGTRDWNWQVEYNDGEVSIPMAYDIACEYASMFGGKVVKIIKE